MKYGKVIEMYTTNTTYYAIKLSQKKKKKKTVDDLFQNKQSYYNYCSDIQSHSTAFYSN